MKDPGSDIEDSIPSPEQAAPPKPPLRGLWRLMGGAAPTASVENDAASDTPAVPIARDAAPAIADASVESVRPARGLWGLMRHGEAAPDAATPNSTPPATSVEPSKHSVPVAEIADAGAAPRAGGRGLWALMQPPAEPIADPPPTFVTPEPTESREPAAADVSTDEPLRSDLPDEVAENTPSSLEEHLPDDESAAVPEAMEGPPRPPLTSPAAVPAEAPQPIADDRPLSQTALIGFAAGLLSLPLLWVATLPAYWGRLPASTLGLAAVAAGLSAWNDLAGRRARRRGKGFATVGLLAGLAGMLLGPLVVAPWAEQRRELSGRSYTRAHLQALGDGFARHDEVHQQFPAGGVFQKSLDGRDIPMHGWMTALLPYIGESALYDSIHLRLPYNDDENFRAMSTEVPAYLAAGGDRSPIGRGYAPAHFSGVGGSLVIPGQGLAHFGVFDQNSAVRREDVVDGLSQTLIVGEISQLHAAWGEPGNWRSIGDGLNRQASGFGNSEGSGALFLKADGSVQFFPNATSPDVLRALSTRDGGDSTRLPPIE